MLSKGEKIVGNVTVEDYAIDFYLTDSIGEVIFRYNKTLFRSFNFTSTKKESYTLHFLNLNQDDDTVATINYSIQRAPLVIDWEGIYFGHIDWGVYSR